MTSCGPGYDTSLQQYAQLPNCKRHKIQDVAIDAGEVEEFIEFLLVLICYLSMLN